jgi:hypothetical protein
MGFGGEVHRIRMRLHRLQHQERDIPGLIGGIFFLLEGLLSSFGS